MKISQIEKNANSRQSIILIANSSWYLFHYRAHLIDQIKNSKYKPIAIAPKDNFSMKLSNICELKEWPISRKNTLNILALIKPFISLFYIFWNCRPHIIHSHTLKSNLIVSIFASIFGYRTVLSFTGLGTLSKKN